jgi:hypothetical protein
MDRGRVGDERGSKETDGCPLTNTSDRAPVVMSMSLCSQCPWVYLEIELDGIVLKRYAYMQGFRWMEPSGMRRRIECVLIFMSGQGCCCQGYRTLRGIVECLIGHAVEV